MADQDQGREFRPVEVRLRGEEGGEGVVCQGFERVVCGRFVRFGLFGDDGGAVAAGREGEDSCVWEQGADVAGEEGER